MMTTPIISPIADLQRQLDLLQMEYEYEKETYRQQSERIGIHRKIQQGLCWYPVISGKSYYNSLNQLVIEVERRDDKEIEHNFEYGRPVCFFTTNGTGNPRYFNFSSIISYVQEDRMVVSLPTPSALFDLQAADSSLGVQLYFDETSYKTMFQALSNVMKAKNNRLSDLRDILIGKTCRTPQPVSNPLSLAEHHPGRSSQPRIGCQRRFDRTRSSRNRKNDHTRGGYL